MLNVRSWEAFWMKVFVGLVRRREGGVGGKERPSCAMLRL